ncbi:hypothetical protein [Flavobacterium branchiophilum]|uniref:Uncharacterized protein n=1 Tax=Flavobacterium branchiophilum TaxID=55197 RepID=A0A2H3KSF2_9FLAO|nr:hypothetical protein [Flavobacterium branchiophilum]PDS22400.1 hypothetical protein B0A77_13585 [Flavobacterium branchiophilum]
MEQLTTYRAKGKTIGLLFLFKYNLNGHLKLFEISEGELNNEQMNWLFSSNFPANENIIKTIWSKDKKYTKVFDIEKSPADLSFEALWNLYDNKVKKYEAEKSFKKLKEADIIKSFLAVPGYNKYLQRKGIAKAHLSTFINQRYFEDDWSKA